MIDSLCLYVISLLGLQKGWCVALERFFLTRIFPFKKRILLLCEKIRARENPYSHLFYTIKIIIWSVDPSKYGRHMPVIFVQHPSISHVSCNIQVSRNFRAISKYLAFSCNIQVSCIFRAISEYLALFPCNIQVSRVFRAISEYLAFFVQYPSILHYFCAISKYLALFSCNNQVSRIFKMLKVSFVNSWKLYLMEMKKKDSICRVLRTILNHHLHHSKIWTLHKKIIPDLGTAKYTILVKT